MNTKFDIKMIWNQMMKDMIKEKNQSKNVKNQTAIKKQRLN